MTLKDLTVFSNTGNPLYYIVAYDRYSDFVVNEVGLDGEVVVLTNTKYDYPDKRRNGDNAVKNEKVLIAKPCSHLSLPQVNRLSISLHSLSYSPQKR